MRPAISEDLWVVPTGTNELMPHCRENLLASKTAPVPQTDTGRQVENTKVREITLVKELGKIAS
jgi:hypothetical protein